MKKYNNVVGEKKNTIKWLINFRASKDINVKWNKIKKQRGTRESEY